MPDDRVVVVGGGLAGLAAAVRLAATGRPVTVLERNEEAGGCATTYPRGRFRFEASLHLLDAVGPSEPNRRVLEDLGVASRVSLVRPEPLRREIWPELGVDLSLPQGRARAEDALCRAFPADARGFAALFDLAARVHAASYARLDREPPAPADALAVARAARSTAGALLAGHLSDPRARAVLGSQAHYVGTRADAIGAAPFLILLHGYVGIGGWAVVGGSRSLAEALAAELAARGGRLCTGAEVVGIEVERRRVRAVVARDGQRWEAGSVLAAIPPPIVYGRLLPAGVDPGAPSDRPLGPSFARLSVGLSRELPGVPYETGVGGEHACAITVPTAATPGWAPAGASVATCTVAVPPTAQRWPPEEAKAVRDRLLGYLDRHLCSGLASHVEELDLAQPATYARRVGAPDGAVLGYALGPGPRALDSRTGIAGLYLAGGWTFPGPGQTAAMISGLLAARELSRGRV